MVVDVVLCFEYCYLYFVFCELGCGGGFGEFCFDYGDVFF